MCAGGAPAPFYCKALSSWLFLPYPGLLKDKGFIELEAGDGAVAGPRAPQELHLYPKLNGPPSLGSGLVA